MSYLGRSLRRGLTPRQMFNQCILQPQQSGQIYMCVHAYICICIYINICMHLYMYMYVWRYFMISHENCDFFFLLAPTRHIVVFFQWLSSEESREKKRILFRMNPQLTTISTYIYITTHIMQTWENLCLECCSRNPAVLFLFYFDILEAPFKRSFDDDFLDRRSA